MNETERYAIVEATKQLLPKPIREDVGLPGEAVWIGGEPGDVIVQVDQSELIVSVYGVRWDGPHTLVLCPQRLASLSWMQFPPAAIKIVIHELIDVATKLRRAQYRRCNKCNETKPPEWMHGDDICQSCAEGHYGIVH